MERKKHPDLGSKAISPFNVKKYSGTWYEIARMDFRFERNLNNTTAHYSFNDDGNVRVVNRGYNYFTNVWKQAVGRAKFAGDDNTAKLKVSFFRPFYSSYNVIALDDEYTAALVAGKNLKYLWILSRETSLSPDIKQKYLDYADELGFDTAKLVWVEHDKQ